MVKSRRSRGGMPMEMLSVKTDRRTQLVDVTAKVQKGVSAAGVRSGICYLYVPHTTAAITINECADPDVARDIEGALDRLVPAAGAERDSGGESGSHVKSVVVGARLVIHVESGEFGVGGLVGGFFWEVCGAR